MFIEPTAEQITELLEGGQEGPVVMLNLPKFRAGDGEATYRRYGEAVLPIVAAAGPSAYPFPSTNRVEVAPGPSTTS